VVFGIGDQWLGVRPKVANKSEQCLGAIAEKRAESRFIWCDMRQNAFLDYRPDRLEMHAAPQNLPPSSKDVPSRNGGRRFPRPRRRLAAGGKRSLRRRVSGSIRALQQ
jgi:hypothetical protein